MNRLTDAVCQFISLVDNGANRDPFRITKHSRGAALMIDLNRIPFFKKAEPIVPEVAFIAVSKSFGAEKALALLAKGGLIQVGETEEQEAGLLIKTANLAEGDPVLTLKLSDDVVIGVRTEGAETIQKGFSSYAWESTDFKTVLAQESVFPMVSIACMALQDTIYNAMYKAEDNKDAGSYIDAALNDFAEVVKKTIKNVPAVAYKLDEALSQLVATAPVETVEKAQDPEIEAQADGDGGTGNADEASTTVIEKADGEASAEDGGTTIIEKAEGEAEAELEAPEPKAAPEVTQASIDLGPVLEAIAKLGDRIGAVEKTTKDTATGLKKMDEAIGAGVTATPSGDLEVSSKSDDDDEPVWENIDTGYAPLT